MATIEPGSRRQAAHAQQPWTASAIWLPIAEAWRSLAQRWAQALRNRRDVEALSHLDDLQLKDIGLTRGQIESFVADGSKQNASARQIASAFRACEART